ncbi:MAG: response regulator transcription factor [Clostridiales bacterium]|nr:response regulator transcription factor [Clostridiales bacterium]
MKILLVDDEKQLTDALSVILKKNNFSIDVSNNGEDGLDMALSGIYDLIILDIMMPKIDGLSVLKTLRNNKNSTPVLMLSAKSEISDKIDGLNLGADDYLTKPFSMEELIARIKALLRRKEAFTGDILSFGDILLNRDTIELECNGKRVPLGKKEFQILEMLILNQGKSIDKDRFIEKIWGYDTDAEYNTIEVYVSFLRKKLASVKSKTEIKSIRGVGYTIGISND